jgi:hypothetical protein
MVHELLRGMRDLLKAASWNKTCLALIRKCYYKTMFTPSALDCMKLAAHDARKLSRVVIRDPEVCPECALAQVVAHAMGDAAYSRLIRYAFITVGTNSSQCHPLVALLFFGHCGYPSSACACHIPYSCTGMQYQD